MKKLTLMASIMLIWGCSQAEEQSADAVKAEAKTQVEKKVESVKSAAIEKASDEIATAADKAVAKATGEVEQAVTVMTSDDKPAYQAGIHYSVINPAYDTNSEKEVVVYEFFGYPCNHCATFEPYMHKLEAELPENSKIVRVPVVFAKQWEPFAKAYYTFEAMGIVEEAHGPMFEAIHQHKKQFRSIEDIANWAASSFNVDKEQFLSTAKSFMVDGQVRKGMQMLQAMGVSSTPTLITNGKFKPNGDALRTRGDFVEVTKFLVNQELATMNQ